MRRVVLLLTAVALTLAACGGDDGEVTAGAPTSTTPAAPPALHEATGTVLESPEHGPELCLGGVEDSYPPQCGGTPLVGWDWAAVDDEESASGTTWGDFHVVGTWDGERLTVTEPPGPPQYADAPAPDFDPVCDEPTGDPGRRGAPNIGEVPDVVRLFVSDDPAGVEPFVFNVVVRPGAAEAVTAAVREHWDGLLCVVERDEPMSAELERAQSEVEATIDEDTPLGEVLGVGIYVQEPYVAVEVVVLTPEGEAYAAERWGDLVRVTGRLQPVV